METISPAELFRRLDGGESLAIIDVRTPLEFRAVHVAGATNVPLDGLNQSRILREIGTEKDDGWSGRPFLI